MDVRADRFPLFDSLRSIAALAIVLHHTVLFVPGAMPDRLVTPATRLDLGVTVFFLISAFLLYRPFVKARRSGGGPPPALAYAWHRFLRIAPAYWVALTAIAIWIGLRAAQSPERVGLIYGFGAGFVEDPVFTMPQAWSLTVEVCFYAFLPLWALGVAALMRRAGRDSLAIEVAALLVLVAISTAFKGWVISTDAHQGLTAERRAFPVYLDQFALGMLLAVASVWIGERASSPRPVRLIERAPALAWLGAAAAFTAICAGFGPGGNRVTQSGLAYLTTHWLSAAVAFCLLLPAVFGDHATGLVRRFLATRAMLWLGLVSYGVFLYHWAVMLQLREWDVRPGGPAAYFGWTLLAVLGAVLLAALSYYLVERRALSLKRLVGYRGRPRDPEAIGEPAPLTPPRVAEP
jgi:peptidoglycan/LPS O-acetylase OafA/YrhL